MERSGSSIAWSTKMAATTAHNKLGGRSAADIRKHTDPSAARKKSLAATRSARGLKVNEFGAATLMP
jgi:hypothetical protein